MFKRLLIIALAFNIMGFAADGKEGHSKPAQAAGAGAGATNAKITAAQLLADITSRPYDDAAHAVAFKPTGPLANKLCDTFAATALGMHELADKLTTSTTENAKEITARIAALSLEATNITKQLTELIIATQRVPKALEALLNGRALAWNGACATLAVSGAYMIVQGKHKEGALAFSTGMFGIAGSPAVLNNCTLM